MNTRFFVQGVNLSYRELRCEPTLVLNPPMRYSFSYDYFFAVILQLLATLGQTLFPALTSLDLSYNDLGLDQDHGALLRSGCWSLISAIVLISLLRFLCCFHARFAHPTPEITDSAPITLLMAPSLTRTDTEAAVASLLELGKIRHLAVLDLSGNEIK
jgi:hypothetical protein